VFKLAYNALFGKDMVRVEPKKKGGSFEPPSDKRGVKKALRNVKICIGYYQENFKNF
jgi:hypothetical protein